MPAAPVTESRSSFFRYASPASFFPVASKLARWCGLAAAVLLGTVKATEALLLQEPLAAIAHWLELLVAADVVYLAIGFLTFDVILEG